MRLPRILSLSLCASSALCLVLDSAGALPLKKEFRKETALIDALSTGFMVVPAAASREARGVVIEFFQKRSNPYPFWQE